jgi:hypothetical protein
MVVRLLPVPSSKRRAVESTCRRGRPRQRGNLPLGVATADGFLPTARRTSGIVSSGWGVGIAWSFTMYAGLLHEHCPNCPVSVQARARFFDDDFGFNLAALLLPFLIVGAVCLRIEALGRARRGGLP